VSGIAVINREVAIPRIASELDKGHGEDGRGTVPTCANYDRNGFLFTGRWCVREKQAIEPAFVTLLPQAAGNLVELRAREAKYVPPGAGHPLGGWVLTDAIPDDLPAVRSVLDPLGKGCYFLHTSLTFERMARRSRSVEYLSTAEILRELKDPGSSFRTRLAVLLHTRLTRPLVSLTMMMLGIPFVLWSTQRNVVGLMGWSLLLGLAFHSFCFLCQRAGEGGHISASLTVWIPLFVFGSLAAVLFDLVSPFQWPLGWIARKPRTYPASRSAEVGLHV
jgi:lipopolysaccharide export system permease protein